MELAYKFVKSKDLVNRIYNMVVYFEIIKDLNHEDIIKKLKNKKYKLISTIIFIFISIN